MRNATTLLVAAGALFVAGCSLLIDAKLDGKSTSSGSGGEGGGDMASSASTSGGDTSAGATTSTTAAQSASASSGGCGSDCALANAMSDCVDSSCAIIKCDSHFDDCDTKPENGCEANLSSDVAHCGSCNKACDSDENCSGSKCK